MSAAEDYLQALKPSRDERLAFEVDRQLLSMEARVIARAEMAASLTANAPPVDAGTLAEILARPQEDRWRVEGLLPDRGRLLLSAQRKTGKTVAALNLARSLLTGDPFLDRFPTTPIGGRVVFLNFEVSAAQVARWADDLDIPRDRLYLVNLRGRRNLLADEAGRAELVDLIKAADGRVLIVDPFGRAYTGRSQDDAAEVAPWLVRLDTVAEDAGCSEVVLTAHAGWNGERTRGSSALEDWPDSIVTMTRDADSGERFLKAEGRDVDVEEDRLLFDPTTRRLSLTGAGSRQVVAQDRKVEAAMPDVVTALEQAAEPLSGRAIEDTVRASTEHTQKAVREAVKRLVRDRRITPEPGPKRAMLHRLNALSASVRESASPVRQRTGVSASVRHIDDALHSPPTDAVRDNALGTCQACGFPLDPNLADAGESTHPACGA